LPRVLLVDDDHTITSLLKTLLELEPIDFDVRVSALGSDALTDAIAHPPDIFMVDYHLKDMNGLDLITQLREHFVETPIIMASGLDIEGKALQAGADMFLLKPFEPGDLPGIFMELIGYGTS
jgi:DNA-binding response OmpR family regulator